MPVYGLQRSLLDGLSMTFLTLLSGATAPVVHALLQQHVLKGARAAELCRAPPMPAGGARPHVLFEQFWLEAGEQPLPDEEVPDEFVLTPSVRRHLATLARAALLRKHPILLQARAASLLTLFRASAVKTASFLGLSARFGARADVQT